MRQIGILQKAGHSALASALLLVSLGQARSTFGQPKSLEERQPLEMVFADSIVPQDRHETMLTTGVWYFRHGSLHSASLTQKVEWGISDHAFHGWAIGEVSFSSNRWSGGNETRFVLTPAYVWRPAKRSELLVGIPIGLTSSTDRVGGVVKFTFELDGKPD